jgi:hypothetical protein
MHNRWESRNSYCRVTECIDEAGRLSGRFPR